MKPIDLKLTLKALAIIFTSALVVACGQAESGQGTTENNMHAANAAIAKGPHGGRMLTSGDFALELAIVESGTPPELHAWASSKGRPLNPAEVELTVTLTRLGGKTDEIRFAPHGDALRGDSIVYEPHSFTVNIDAEYSGAKHHWTYDSFEGRTKIAAAVAGALGVATDIAGPVVLQPAITAFGKIIPNAEGVRHVSARFPGVIRSVSVSIGDTVRKGQVLATVESNESLKLYEIKAPAGGVITGRNASAGEQAAGQILFTITDTSAVWVDLSIFPADQQLVTVGAPVLFTPINTGKSFEGKIAMIDLMAETNQSVTARMHIENKGGQLLPGIFVTARVKTGEISVPLAVKRSALQSFRDFTVVYAQVGEEYEVRMLELGRRDDEWVEVLGGLEPGTRYVTENSYVIKADIEKSGAAHHH